MAQDKTGHMARAMAAQPLTDAQRLQAAQNSAADAAKRNAPPVHPAIKLFGQPVFTLVRSPKPFKNDNGSVATKLATFTVTLGNTLVAMHGSITRTVIETTEDDGTYVDESLRANVPMIAKFTAGVDTDDPETAIQIDTLRNRIWPDAFEAWFKTLGRANNANTAQTAVLPRIVRRKVEKPTLPPQPQQEQPAA